MASVTAQQPESSRGWSNSPAIFLEFWSPKADLAGISRIVRSLSLSVDLFVIHVPALLFSLSDICEYEHASLRSVHVNVTVDASPSIPSMRSLQPHQVKFLLVFPGSRFCISVLTSPVILSGSGADDRYDRKTEPHAYIWWAFSVNLFLCLFLFGLITYSMLMFVWTRLGSHMHVAIVACRVIIRLHVTNCAPIRVLDISIYQSHPTIFCATGQPIETSVCLPINLPHATFKPSIS
jgi:hypothetical protein